mgnify:CR=1 FL=1|tara:strand:- start:197 stop:418 length:222 start_codon:yes stop_codon:yes gene_type:complete
MTKEKKVTPEIKAKLLMEDVKFSLMITNERHCKLIASRIQRERMETLNEYGISSEFERKVSEYLLSLNTNYEN